MCKLIVMRRCRYFSSPLPRPSYRGFRPLELTRSQLVDRAVDRRGVYVWMDGDLYTSCLFLCVCVSSLSDWD